MRRRYCLTLVILLLPLFSAVGQADPAEESLGDKLVPIVSQIGFGAAVGFICGFALKKVGKVIAIGLGILFIAAQVLAYLGVIQIDWGPISNWWERFTEQEAMRDFGDKIQSIFLSSLPSVGGAVAGFLFGLKKG